jgi:hypothetical protein
MRLPRFSRWLILILLFAFLPVLLQPRVAKASSATDTDIPNPDAYTCNQPGYIDFEQYPDGTNLSANAISGVQFTTTNGFTWLVGDFATGNYNGKYPNGGYTSQGTHWAWLGTSQGAGRIDFVNGPITDFSLLVSANTPVVLEAYDANDNLLATAGPAAINYNTGHMDELKITRDTADMAYVIVHDTGNYFLVDSICTNAGHVPNQTIDYKQNVGTWANTPVNPTYTPSCQTMAQIGCAITAVADVMASYGITLPDGTKIDPGNLNQFLGQHGALEGCYIVWGEVSTLLGNTTETTVPYWQPFQTRLNEINTALANGDLPIISVQNSFGGTHYIVLYQRIPGTNGAPDDYLILDPFHYANDFSHQLLSQTYGPIANFSATMDVIHYVNGNKPGTIFALAGHSPIELLITDPNGFQTGFNPKTSSYLNNIPGTFYEKEAGIHDDNTVPAQPDRAYFQANFPTNGTYNIQVIGVGTGPYTLNFIRALTGNGDANIQSVQGNVTPGSVDTYQVTVPTHSHIQISPSPVSLTTPVGTSPSPQTLALKNTGTGPLTWSSNSLPSWVSVSPTSGLLAPGASQPLTLTFNTPTAQAYTTNLVITDVNADNSPASVPITVVSANVSKTWYFAEGFTGGNFSEFLTIANPNTVQANVQVTYLLGSGAPIVKTYPVAPTSRFTIKVNNEIGPNQNVSMVVNSDQPIIAERPMYFTFTGGGLYIPGGSDVLGETSLSQNFDFGYLDTTGGHATFLTILNQNNVTMNVTINYFSAVGGAPFTRTHTVGPNSRGTVNVNQENLPPDTYSALVSLDQPGLVERPLYLVDSFTGYTGSADVVGIATPHQVWNFAEGFTSPTFDERYILSNPSTSTTANAIVTFYLSNGTTQVAQVTMAPGQQQIVDANALLGSNNVNNSAKVQADQPILAERFISFLYTGAVGGSNSSFIPGASDVLGAAARGNLFYFAEGYTGPQFAEYLTIENPDKFNTAYVTITFLPANGGAPIVRVYAIAPSSRFTLFTNSVLNNQSFSMVVESNIAITAERPMYFNFTGGQTGGSDVIGYQP